MFRGVSAMFQQLRCLDDVDDTDKLPVRVGGDADDILVAAALVEELQESYDFHGGHVGQRLDKFGRDTGGAAIRGAAARKCDRRPA